MNFKARVRSSVPNSVLWRMTPMRLYWAGNSGPNDNFGDQLSPVLVKNIFGLSSKHSGINAADIIAVGSLMEGIEESARSDAWVWGAGYIEDGAPWNGEEIRVAAVRGRLTADRVKCVRGRGKIVLGDPGMVVDKAFPELRKAAKKWEIGLIPHFTEVSSPRTDTLSAAPGVKVIDVMRPPHEVIADVVACRIIVSSSLHGLIVAESFGVPNYWMAPGEGITGGEYKFADHYSAFGVTPHPSDPEEVLANPDTAVRRWEPLPKVDEVKTALLRAFPGLFWARGDRTRRGSAGA